MKSTTSKLAATTAALAHACAAIQMDTSNTDSIKTTAKTVAGSNGLFFYHNPDSTVGQFNQPEPWNWWESGAAWTGLMDYMYFTGDVTHMADLVSSLSINVGEAFDFAPASQQNWEANDDQAYWLYNALTAMEYGFEPLTGAPTWDVIADNVFNVYAGRWNADSATCNGGMKWQYNPTANGYYYKNTVSNGAFFQTAARLSRFHQGENHTYAEWATKIWDWTTAVGFMTPKFEVFDGAGDDKDANCTALDKTQWSYNLGTYLHGAAHMFNVTDDVMWEDRVKGLLKTAEATFFNEAGVMYESHCENQTVNPACNDDQKSFKASLARWMAKTAVLVPSVKEDIMGLLTTSAAGAAQACAGNGTCGMSWTVGGFDKDATFGTQLSALETIQSLLVFNAPKLAVAS